MPVLVFLADEDSGQLWGDFIQSGMHASFILGAEIGLYNLTVVVGNKLGVLYIQSEGEAEIQQKEERYQTSSAPENLTPDRFRIGLQQLLHAGKIGAAIMWNRDVMLSQSLIGLLDTERPAGIKSAGLLSPNVTFAELPSTYLAISRRLR